VRRVESVLFRQAQHRARDDLRSVLFFVSKIAGRAGRGDSPQPRTADRTRYRPTGSSDAEADPA
jgi:hypothetical protein